MAIILKTEEEVLSDISGRSKRARLMKNLTQQGLAKRAGVSLSSLKRFESTGQISMKSLIRIMFALECIDQSEYLFKQLQEIQSLDDIKKLKRFRQRGHENN